MLAKTELTQTQKDLLAAADYIEEHGWTQCRLYNEHGNVCLNGALMAVITERPLSELTTINLNINQKRIFDSRIAIFKYLKTGSASWNDTYGRTKDEVVEALRNAAFSE